MTELLLLTRCLNFLTNSTAEKPINREKTVTKKPWSCIIYNLGMTPLLMIWFNWENFVTTFFRDFLTIHY